MTDDALRAALGALFPAVERARWPFTVEQAAAALTAALAASAPDERVLFDMPEDARPAAPALDVFAIVERAHATAYPQHPAVMACEYKSCAYRPFAREYAALRPKEPTDDRR